MNLSKPAGSWRKCEKAWKRLTTTLFVQLQDALAKEEEIDFPALCHDLKTWLPLDSAEKRYRWRVAYRVLCCAELAVGYRNSQFNKIERFIFQSNHVVQLLKGHEAWVVDCIRQLLGHVSPATLRLDLPVALSDELTSSRGTLATLRLQSLGVPSGGGGVFHYPADSLLTYSKPDFDEALESAWQAANKLAQAHEAQDVAGDWRLLLSGHPAREVGGRSASGAAALGFGLVSSITWHHAG